MKREDGWIDAREELPKENNLVLVIVSGNPKPGLYYFDAYELGGIVEGEWVMQSHMDWRGSEVKYWRELPKRPKEIEEKE